MKVTILLEELLALGIVEAEYDAARPATQHGRRVVRTQADELGALRERHAASDFEKD